MRRILSTILLTLIVLLTACGGTSTKTTTAGTSCQPLAKGTGSFVYVAIGASDAVGFGATCPDTDGYVPLLGKKMPAHAQVVNLGIGGETVRGAILDELPEALTAKPNLITVWLAANDFKASLTGSPTLDQYAAQLDQMLSALHDKTTAHVYIGNLPDLTQLPAFQHGSTPLDTIASQTNAWNAVIATTVARYGFTLVDLYHSDIASHPEYIFADGFHPSSLGYQQLANAFWATIAANGGPTSK